VSGWSLLWGVMFSSIGAGFCIYAARQRAPIPLLCGAGLIICPYVLSNPFALIAVGIALCAVPVFFRD
jgi:predicted membrane protein